MMMIFLEANWEVVEDGNRNFNDDDDDDDDDVNEEENDDKESCKISWSISFATL